MLALSLHDRDIKTKLTVQSQEAIKNLIQSAESTRRSKNSKSTDFLSSFFKEAKKHII
jgi:hypothetical protein